jgi:hypothetical protein
MIARTGIAWYVDRLRVMSAREIVHRLREQYQLRALERSQRRLHEAREPGFAFCTAMAPYLPAIVWDEEALQTDAADLLSGRSDALGAKWQWHDDGDCWYRAPDTGALWPREYFNRVSHRQGNPYGDIRRLWEPARLQQLVGLALVARDPVRRQAAMEAFERQLHSWLDANPAYIGPHYVSAMECALRLIAVCHAADLIRQHGEPTHAIMTQVARLVSSHAHLILRRPSLHSSAGNHSLAEATGLLYAGYLFPELRIARRCRSLGEDMLDRECPRQILPDGGGVEQSTSYLRFIVDLVSLGAALLRAHGRDVERFDRRVQRAHAFLAALGPFAEPGCGIGDADGGYALSRYARLCPDRSEPGRSSTTFVESGYSTICGPRTTHIVFDHGPLGMAPLYAHGHADCLSVLVARSGRPLLIDPGTFTYSGDPMWRAYFRGTRAHNTITVDGQDQAVQRGAFAWEMPFAARSFPCAPETGVVLLATHDGYSRLGVRHWRGVIHLEPDRILVWDRLTGTGEHRLDLCWHLAIPVSLRGQVVRSIAVDIPISLTLSGSTSIDLHHAIIDPVAGWCAPRYGVKDGAWTVCATRVGRLPHEMLTMISLSANAERSTPDARERAVIVAFRQRINAH